MTEEPFIHQSHQQIVDSQREIFEALGRLTQMIQVQEALEHH